MPIFTFLSTGKDRFRYVLTQLRLLTARRKPRTGVYDYMISDVNSGVTPSEVYYVGDAAGRYLRSYVVNTHII